MSDLLNSNNGAVLQALKELIKINSKSSNEIACKLRDINNNISLLLECCRSQSSGGSSPNEVIAITNEITKSIAWTPQRQTKYGDFPVIDVWILYEGEYVKVEVPYITDADPPDTTLITLNFDEPVTGFLIIS